ncbi:eukaryotic translation initiation factor 1 [Exaiptasia diaphana]|uniref:SUI1 domain-containing protein n=1 Tax=Exaiptasia diaphana TaxID=2652724 RepID=A0A913X9W9_EXADI|nr:eukaryotic translation initiation factor 1 [Exaiptasia diaphana]KXJ14122.1 Protein translation factor SUI1-like [Exaiptasia diaphana]
MSIENLKSTNPFDEVSEGDETSVQVDDIHIRIQQRNGRKTLTTIQGISDEYDLKKILRQFKKKFACNGTVVDHDEYGEVIQLQGDQRKHAREFLLLIKLVKPEQVKVHGF